MLDHNITSLLCSIERQLLRIADSVCRSESSIHENRPYSREDATRLLGVSTHTIDTARRKGKLNELKRLGARYVRIPGESMLAYQRVHHKTRVHVLKI